MRKKRGEYYFSDTSEEFGSVLDDYVKALGLKNKLNERKVLELYPQVVGATFARYTTNLVLEHGRLYISLNSSMVRNELMMVRTKLMDSLNKAVGAEVVRDIVLR